MNQKLRFTLLFCIGFASAMLLANNLPTFYYTYVDISDYYTLKQPVSVEQDTIEQCGSVTLSFDRKASEKLSVNSIGNLVIVNSNLSITKLPYPQATFVINKGNQIIQSKSIIPCDSPLGEARIEGVITYSIHGATRNYFWKSESFTIMKKTETPIV